jgi:hypothetical protein
LIFEVNDFLESLYKAVDAELAARGADDDPILNHEGRHRGGLAFAQIGAGRAIETVSGQELSA